MSLEFRQTMDPHSLDVLKVGEDGLFATFAKLLWHPHRAPRIEFWQTGFWQKTDLLEVELNDMQLMVNRLNQEIEINWDKRSKS